MRDVRSSIAHFFSELRRRKVYTAAAAYIAVSLVLREVGEAVFEAFLFPDVAERILTVLLILAAPIVLVLAWIFDIGPQGVHRTADAPARGGAADRARAERVPVGVGGWIDVAPPAAPSARASESEIVEQAPAPERVRQVSIAHVRHELRTPINAIIGYGEMLLDDAEAEDDPAVEDLRRIVTAGRELLTKVDQILGAERVTGEERDVESYASQIRASLREPLNSVTGYAEMLLEASREAGRAQRVPDLERILSAARRLLELSTDIVQVATSASDATQSLSRSSALAEGVLAKLRPLAHAEEEDHQGSLLVVDDNAMNRDLLARQLARRGYVVATAENGREALDRLGEQSFDVLLLDVMMPEMDGVEVLRRLKSDAKLRELPVIMISALDEIDSVIRCLEMGAADYMTKPFHPTLLAARIGACLSARQTGAREARLRAAIAQRDDLFGRLSAGVFPASVAARLQHGEARVIDGSADASALWCDFSRAMGGASDPLERAARFESLLALLEEVARDAGVETLLVQGNAVVLASGFPAAADAHAERLAETALAFLARAAQAEVAGPRMGLHAGSFFGAVVGSDRLSYCVWGDAPELAQALSREAEAGHVHISPAVHTLVKARFACVTRGVVELAGRGQLRTWALRPGAPAATATS